MSPPHPLASAISPPDEETVTISDAPSAPADSPAEAPADSALSEVTEVTEVAQEMDQDAPADDDDAAAAPAAAPADDEAAAAPAAAADDDDDEAAADADADDAPKQCNRTSQIGSAVVH